MHCADMDVGDTTSLRGILRGVKYDIFCMKEEDYVMKIMSTYGSLEDHPDQHTAETRRTYKRNGVTTKKEFKYKIPFGNHFRYRHAVDDHNNLRHQSPALEEVWVTKRWPIRVFTFLLAITEVNLFLILRFFIWKGEERRTKFQSFRKDLAFSLIYNKHIAKETTSTSSPPTSPSKRPKLRSGHKLVTKPPYTGTWAGGRWNTSKIAYQQYRCSNVNCTSSKSGGRAQVRTYCSCAIGRFLCNTCWGNHLTTEAAASGLPIESLRY